MGSSCSRTARSPGKGCAWSFCDMVVLSGGDAGAADCKHEHMLPLRRDCVHLHGAGDEEVTGKFVKLGHLGEVKVVASSWEDERSSEEELSCGNVEE